MDAVALRSSLLIAPLLLTLFAGCIGTEGPNVEPDLSTDVNGDGKVSLDDYRDCEAPRATYAGSQACRTDHASAIVVDALPPAAVCVDHFDGFSVHLDPPTRELYLTLDKEVRGFDYVTGAYYQPSSSGTVISTGSHISEFTSATNGEHIRLESPLGTRYSMADKFLFAFQGLNVTTTGDLERYKPSVDWLLIEREFFSPVYSFYGKEGSVHFADAAPLQLQGTDFGLDLKADVYADGETWHAIQNKGC